MFMQAHTHTKAPPRVNQIASFVLEFNKYTQEIGYIIPLLFQAFARWTLLSAGHSFGA